MTDKKSREQGKTPSCGDPSCPEGENEPEDGQEIVPVNIVQFKHSKQFKFTKKVDIVFQLLQLKRFILFGTETHYKSADRRSINRWFVTETNIRLYVGGCSIKCLRCLSIAVEVLIDSNDEEDKLHLNDIISRVSSLFMDNVHISPIGVIPFILARTYHFWPLRAVVRNVFLTVIRDATELLLFAHYLKKVKGNHTCSRRLFIEWYRIHSSDPELLKDLLLVKRRMGWSHRDILVHWKIPVTESDGILRLLMGFPYEPSKVPQKHLSLINKLIKLRNVDDREAWIRVAESKEYNREVGLAIYQFKHLKTQIFNIDVIKMIIEQYSLNDYIEVIPKMWLKYNYKKELTKIMTEQLRNWKSKYDSKQLSKVNILSVFVVWKWLCLQSYLFHGEGKILRESGHIDSKYYPIQVTEMEEIMLTILEDNLYKRSEEILFILNIPEADFCDKGFTFAKKPNQQELKRPFIYPNMIKPSEFIQFLLFIYPNNYIFYQDHYYKISGTSYQMVESEMLKIKEGTAEGLTEPPTQTFTYSIHATFDGAVDSTVESVLKGHQVTKIVILSLRDKDVTQAKEQLVLRNHLVLKGLDCNFLSLIENYFHNLN